MTDNVLCFPDGFIWGTATSAHQIEGGVAEGGRGVSIWDTFCQSEGTVFQGHTGDVACDHYHRFRPRLRLLSDPAAFRQGEWSLVSPGY